MASQCLCSWTFETERVCWTPGCPSAYRSWHPAVPDPLCHLVPELLQLNSGACLSAPCPPRLSHPLWNPGKAAASWFAPRSASTRDRLAPFHLAAPGPRPPPALALNLHGPRMDGRCLSLSPRLQGGCGAASGSLSAPPHPKVFCLLCSVVGRSLRLARKLDSHVFG